MKITNSFILLLLLFSLWGCTSTNVAGGGTDVSNPYIAGVVISSENTPVSRAVVSLVPVDYNPIIDNSNEIVHDTTEDDGHFSFLLSDKEKYNLIVNDNSGSRGAIEDSISRSETSDSLQMMVKPYGSVTVVVPSAVQGGILYFEGTDITASAIGDSVTIDNLPVGMFPKLVGVNGDVEEEITEEVQVVSGTSITLPYEFSVLMVGIDSLDGIERYPDFVSEAGGRPILYEEGDLSAAVQSVDLIYLAAHSNLTSSQAGYLRVVDRPLICSKSELYDSLGLVISGQTNSGYEMSNNVLVKSASHKIVEGVFTQFDAIDLYLTPFRNFPVLAWGNPWGGAEHVMVGIEDQDHSMVFTFVEGDSLNGLDAPAKRVGLALTQGEGITEDGITLFKQCLLWSLDKL